jgi:GNAT superfamily N-acetyltransferase
MKLKEIIFKEEVMQTFPILKQIYTTLDHDFYVDQVMNMMHEGYKMAAVIEDGGKCIGVLGMRLIRRINLGKTIEIEDFMIDRQRRGIGVGKMLLKWVDWQAMNLGCENIICDLQTKRRESQAIFCREKYLIDGFSFRKEI